MNQTHYYQANYQKNLGFIKFKANPLDFQVRVHIY